MRIKLTAIVLACVVGSPVEAAVVNRQCTGNLETESTKLLSSGVSYQLSYEINGRHARIGFAGKNLDVEVEYGADWKGPWLNRMDDSGFFSYRPEDDGVLKFRMEEDRWFSGSC